MADRVNQRPYGFRERWDYAFNLGRGQWEAVVTSGPEDPRAAAYSRLRASDADREQVIDTLKVAFAQGRLTMEELDLRAGQAFASRTYADLAAVTADIPARPADARPLPKSARAQGRPPESTVIRWGLGVGAAVLSALIPASLLTGNDVVGNVTAYLLIAYCLFILISVGYAVDLQLEKRRSRRQLPPRPGPDGRNLEGEPHRGGGRNPALPDVRSDETRSDLRTNRSRQDRCESGSPVDVRLVDVPLVRLLQLGRAWRLHVVADRP
jgi:DUF1707 SHOCT-like domain